MLNIQIKRVDISSSSVGSRATSKVIAYLVCTLILLITQIKYSLEQQSSQDSSVYSKTSQFTVDLYHRFGSSEKQHFNLRGSISVRPKTEYRPAQVTWIGQQNKLSEEDLKALKDASDRNDFYYLRSTVRAKKGSDKEQTGPTKIAQTVINSCSLYNTKLSDNLIVNLSPFGDFLGVNLYTEDTDCANQIGELSPQDNSFNTTLTVDLGAIGPHPDTATYLRRLEEERQNKLKEGKEDNRSFFAKYWIYILPAVAILMFFSGPEQANR